MSETIQSASRVIWRLPFISSEPSDVARVRVASDVSLAVMANGFESGFSRCWPTGSRLLLDGFERAWSSTSGDLGGRLDEAFAGACNHFSRTAPVGSDPDVPEAQPAAILLAVAVAGQRAELAWIGGDVGLLIRDAAVVDRTRPHTLAEKFRDEHPETDLPYSPHLGVCTRFIGPGQPIPTLASRASWTLARGDVVLLTSQWDWRREPSDSWLVVRAVSRAPTLEAAVDGVAQAIAVHGDPAFSAVVGLKV